MKKETITPFILPVLCVLLGILAFITADRALQIICYVISGAFILLGLIAIVGYLRRNSEENFASNGFLFGFILLLLGITAIIKADSIALFIPFALGFLITINGIRELQNAIDAYRLALANQWIVVLVALINLVLGIILMVNPGLAVDVLMKAIGIGLIISGIADFVTTMVILGKGGDKNI